MQGPSLVEGSLEFPFARADLAAMLRASRTEPELAIERKLPSHAANVGPGERANNRQRPTFT
jgi:hypothetical protein